MVAIEFLAGLWPLEYLVTDLIPVLWVKSGKVFFFLALLSVLIIYLSLLHHEMMIVLLKKHSGEFFSDRLELIANKGVQALLAHLKLLSCLI